MKKTFKFLVICLFSISYLYGGHAPKEYPKGAVGDMVRLGEDIMLHTNIHPLTRDMVGNTLKCSSCHLKGRDEKVGTTNNIGTFIGTATAFPAYSSREKTVQTLQDRINNCFMRGMDGKRPIIDTEASIAMATYITWLSKGMPMKMNEKRPFGPKNSSRWARSNKKFAKIQRKATHVNYLNGKKIYTAECASCHGDNGQGLHAFSPLWGKNEKGKWLSYNTGANMSQLDKGATWVQSNMPLGEGHSLKNQEAADVMLFINAQDRAPFNLKKKLFPRKKMGYYNSKVHNEHHSVESNFKAFGLDLKKIKGEE